MDSVLWIALAALGIAALAVVVRAISRRHTVPPTTGTVTQPINGVRYLVKDPTDMIQAEVLAGHQFADNILQAALQRTRRGDHVVVVGAHLGSIALPLARARRKVTAFESFTPTYQHLVEHISLNRLSTVRAINVALGNSVETARLGMTDTENSGAYQVLTKEDFDRGSRQAPYADAAHETEVRPLDALDLPRVDLLVIDVEGMELAVLRGARKTIERDQPKIICEIWDDEKRSLERMPTTQDEVVHEVRAMGLDVAERHGWDFVFAPAHEKALSATRSAR